MKRSTLQILYNNGEPFAKDGEGWGLSVLIDQSILFDTGDNGEVLMESLSLCRINIHSIEYIVLSHEHWDHIDGLWAILEESPNKKIVIPAGWSAEFRAKVKRYTSKLIEIDRPGRIVHELFSTGPFKVTYKGNELYEHALVGQYDTGLYVLTGCCHMGIPVLLDKVHTMFPDRPIALLEGGFHLRDAKEEHIHALMELCRKARVQRIIPRHCTGEEASRLLRNYSL